MIDKTNMIFMKEEFGKKDIDPEPFPDLITESDSTYLVDSKLEDVCRQCGKNHNFKPNFEGVKTSIERIPELIPLIFNDTYIIESQYLF